LVSEPFSEKSLKVNVKEGKCVKKERFASLKFNCPFNFWLAKTLTSSAIRPGKSIGMRNNRSKRIPKEIPDTLITLTTIDFDGFFIRQKYYSIKRHKSLNAIIFIKIKKATL